MEWWLTGSAAQRLLGAAVRPRDLDLECDTGHRDRAARALGLDLARCAGRWSSWRAVGTLAGVEVDLSAGVEVHGAGGTLACDDRLTARYAVPVETPWGRVLCAPPEEMPLRAFVSGDWTRLGRLAARGGPPPRLDYVVRRLADSSAVR